MDQQFLELVSCLDVEMGAPVCSCSPVALSPTGGSSLPPLPAPVAVAPSVVPTAASAALPATPKSSLHAGKFVFTTKWKIGIAVGAVVLVAIIILVVYLAMRNNDKSISISDELLELLDPLPEDLRTEAIKFYEHEFSSDLSVTEQAELKSKIMKWADSWVDYEASKKRPPPNPVRASIPPPVNTRVAKEKVRFTEDFIQPTEKKLTTLFATEDVEVSNDFGRITEKSTEVEERMRRRVEQDKRMSQAAGLPFSDEFEPKK